jgi:hypothetical protein
MHENHRSSKLCIVKEDNLLMVAAPVAVIQALLHFLLGGTNAAADPDMTANPG